MVRSDGARKCRMKVEKSLLLEFYADWCAPCRKVAPILSDLAEEFNGKIQFVRVNVDVDSKLAKEYEVYSLPTIVFVRDDREFSRITGAVSRNRYRAAIAQFLTTHQSIDERVSMIPKKYTEI